MNHDIWILPCKVNNSHWVVAIVVFKLKLMDSLHGINHNMLRTIFDYASRKFAVLRQRLRKRL